MSICEDTLYQVKMIAYCGLVVPLLRRANYEDARAEVAERLRSARKSGRVCVKTKPDTWEILSPDDAVMVSDDEGYLVMREDNTCRTE